MKKKPTTILSCLWQLPKKYRKLAVENYKNSRSLNSSYLNAMFEENPSPKEALMYGFSWGESPQGSDFWLKLYESLDRKKKV